MNMSIRSANSAVAMVLMALLCSACVAKSSSSLSATNTKNYQCFELKQLIAERKQMYLQGLLGSQSSVFASADSCNQVLEDAVASAWRTKDEFSCVVGFRCVDNSASAFGRDF